MYRRKAAVSDTSLEPRLGCLGFGGKRILPEGKSSLWPRKERRLMETTAGPETVVIKIFN